MKKKIILGIVLIVLYFFVVIIVGMLTSPKQPKYPPLTEQDIEQQVDDAHNLLINQDRLRTIYSSDIKKAESYAYQLGVCEGYYSQQAVLDPELKEKKKKVREFYDAQVLSLYEVLPLSSKKLIHEGVEKGVNLQNDGNKELDTMCTHVYIKALNSIK